jgi:RNA polymerase sigma-54 factor
VTPPPAPAFGQTQRQTQAQILGVRQLMGLEVLGLSTADLASWLREAHESNECLQLEEPPAALPRPPASVRREASDRHAEWLANLADERPDPRASLREQLSWLGLEDERRAWAEFLLDRLDGDGLLTESDESLLEAAAEADLEPNEASLGRAVADVQRLEPRGVGGRDATEALLLQLAPADPDYPRLCQLIELFLEDVSRNKLPAVARGLGVELDELARLVERLGSLSPVPLEQVEDEEAVGIRPDVVALPEQRPDGVRLRLEFPRSSIPTVTIDAELASMARDGEQPADLRRYLNGKLGRARAVLDAVEARAATLERVARLVFEHQIDYLLHGAGHLAPLSMTEVAEALELAVSTVSRAVSGKYVQTPWGVEPLRRFFQAEGAGGAGESTDGVRERVRAIVAAEDPAAPLSDDAIVDALAREGLRVSRRTVVNHRKALGIASSYRRRRFVA